MTNSILRNPQYKYRLLASIIPTILAAMSFVLINLATTNLTLRKLSLDEASIKNQTYQESLSLNQFVTDNAVSLEKMSMALPSESMMVGVIQDIESVVSQFDPAGTIKLSGQNPVRIGQDLVIPFTVTFQTDVNRLPEFIDQLNRLPYITQLLSFDTQVSGETSLTIINLRMYVQEPFIGY